MTSRGTAVQTNVDALHEIDHLDGVLTVHRAEPAERQRAITALL